MYRRAEIEADGLPSLTAGGWQSRRAEILERWLDALGELPPLLSEPRVELGEAESFPTHVRRRIVFTTGDQDQVPALVLTPIAPGRRPAVLALHPTAEEGKADIATAEGRDDRRYALELVERGYVVLAPDAITAGERVSAGAQPFATAEFVRSHPGTSPVAKMLSDHRHALSVLAALDEVDPTRIGVIGHSLGGYNAWFLAGLDARVAAVVSSCGFLAFAGDPDENRWGERDWFSHFPLLSPMLREGNVPFEWTEILALVAPTPLFTWLATGDEYFPNWRESIAALQTVSDLYTQLEQPDAMVSWVGHGGHDFPAHVREAAYGFLDRRLTDDRSGDAADPHESRT
ncbi:dienelactone hydrolase [Microbacterium sp. W4I4]|uniref:alpha/beta fold hydrolase n=1 Tax=Microbacterium sp. W4I4 TaxID=3042295 RepID=UPI00278A6BCA|nr:dienelactone hydrolase family protein [Microbacterium sp. W4I4]MDQ0615337.1 dienelactone hydrolase [Microbacterium sp. W4I4]